MTIAEKLYQSDKETLLKIIIIYQLKEMARLYFPEIIQVAQNDKAEDDMQEYTKLMMPGSYTGHTERRRGAITQPHRKVLK